MVCGNDQQGFSLAEGLVQMADVEWVLLFFFFVIRDVNLPRVWDGNPVFFLSKPRFHFISGVFWV